MSSVKRRIVSRGSRKKEIRKPKRKLIRSRPSSRRILSRNKSRTKNRAAGPPKRYLIQKKRAELQEKMGNRYVGTSKYIYRKKLSSRTSSRLNSRNKVRTSSIKKPRKMSRPSSRKAIQPSSRKVIQSSSRKSRRASDKEARSKSKSKSESKSKAPVVSQINFSYSGTIIYSGKSPLNPFKWIPEDAVNRPSHYRWETLLPGTHILDKNTFLTWIVEKNRKISLAPCQTIRLDLEVPQDLEAFNPGLCLNPFLPEINRIPSGTRFFFNNSSQCYQLRSDKSLKAVDPGQSRPSQIIPIPFNSLYNTQNLIGLQTPVKESSVQKASLRGYRGLAEWLSGLVKGSDVLPGYFGDLPQINQLQVNDILEFYDPNRRRNPKNSGLNPDGTPYLEGIHESQYFSYRLRIIYEDFVDLNEENHLKLSAVLINDPISALSCEIKIPTEKTNQDHMIYLRSAAVIPKQGSPLVLFNQIDKPYYLKNDLDRLMKDLQNGLVKLGYPYSNIKIMYLMENSQHLAIRFSHLPENVLGIVLSSDLMPYNKFEGSGRFFIGHSSNSSGSIYHFKTGLHLEHLDIREVNIDGVSLELNSIIHLNSNRNIGFLLDQINQKLAELGYSGYTMSIWWSEGKDLHDEEEDDEEEDDEEEEKEDNGESSEKKSWKATLKFKKKQKEPEIHHYQDDLRFYLSGVIHDRLPSMIFNFNGQILPLSFNGDGRR